jgi:hypothetical protein
MGHPFDAWATRLTPAPKCSVDFFSSRVALTPIRRIRQDVMSSASTVSLEVRGQSKLLVEMVVALKDKMDIPV